MSIRIASKMWWLGFFVLTAALLSSGAPIKVRAAGTLGPAETLGAVLRRLSMPAPIWRDAMETRRHTRRSGPRSPTGEMSTG